MVDNLKSAVLRRILGRPPVFNPKYLDFANHCGFTIAACNVGRGNEKGRAGATFPWAISRPVISTPS
jgi:transposase